MSKKSNLFRVLAYLTLLPFLLIAGPDPDYDGYDDLDPDESAYALSKDSRNSAGIGNSRASICSFCNFCSETQPIRYHQSWNTFPEPFTPELIFSVTLRC